MRINELYQLSKNVVSTDKGYFKEIVLKNEGDIIYMVRKQLYGGYIAEDKQLYREIYDNKKYGIEKGKMNPSANGYVDLRYSGSFYSKMYLANNTNSYFKIGSKVDYTEELKKRYGSDIMTLGGSNITTFAEMIVKPQLINQYRKDLQL